MSPRLNRLLERLQRLRPYGTYVGVGGAVLVWAVAFEWGWAKSEWSSIWAHAAPMQGQSVALTPKNIETTGERETRETVQAKGLRDSYHTMKQGVLGDTRATRGDDPRLGERPKVDEGDMTPEEKCEQMKLSDPEKYGGFKCKDADGDGY